jgi:hypothetical protein
MTHHPETLEAVEAALDAVIDRHALGDTPSAETLAKAALDAIPEAIVEHATLYTLSLDTVDREEARFAAAGGFRLTMHRGEWMERGRPARIWISVQEAMEPSAAA